MKRFILCLLVLYVISFGAVFANSKAKNFPFSGKIDWDREEQSKNYEKILQKFGIVKEFYRKTGNEIAAVQECFLLKDANGVVGEAVAFSEFSIAGMAENAKTGDKKRIDIKKVEVVTDKGGGLVLLTTHRFRLNAFEEFMAGLRKKKPYGEHAVYYGPDLGDGYVLDQKTQDFVAALLDAAKKCNQEN